MSDLHKLQFTRSFPPYMPGEIASFPEGHARKLVELGVAERVAAAPDEAEAAPEAAKPTPERDSADAVEAAVVPRPAVDRAMHSPRGKSRDPR